MKLSSCSILPSAADHEAVGFQEDVEIGFGTVVATSH